MVCRRRRDSILYYLTVATLLVHSFEIWVFLSIGVLIALLSAWSSFFIHQVVQCQPWLSLHLRHIMLQCYLHHILLRMTTHTNLGLPRLKNVQPNAGEV